jgi:uroporphyrinogen decarboxylase
MPAKGEKMTGKERVRLALQHKEADRVPTGENQVNGALASEILGYPTLYSTGWEEMQALWQGRRDEIVRDYGRTIVDLARALEWDYVRVPAVPAKKEYRPPKMTGPYSWIDESGEEVHFNPGAGNVIHPDFPTDLTAGELPDPDAPYAIDDSGLDALRYVVKELGDTHFIVARAPFDGTFPWNQTVGMEEFLVRMLTDEDFVRKAVEVYVGRGIKMLEAFLDAGADAVMTTDDYCDNRGPIMGIGPFRKFIVPGIRRQAEAVHKKGGIFIKHTDGYLWDILDDLADCGIDAWHGIQTNIGMDLGKLKQRYRNRFCFFGGANCDTLIDGTPEDVRKEIRDAILGAAPGGGLVVTTSNVLQPGVKIENYRAMRAAVRDYGTYPIKS